MKEPKTIIIVVALLYAAFCVLIFFYQKNLIFFPSKDNLEIPKGMDIEEVFFMTDDSIRLHAWHLNNDSKKTVLFFHGNAGNLSHRRGQLEIFNKLKLNALIFDYRGYGKSEGVIKKESDLYLDAQSAFNYLVSKKGISPQRIILWGRSLGGAIAIHTALNKKPLALIVESSFFSMDEMASKQFPFLPTRLLSRFHFRSNEKIGNINSKILIVHSKDDEMIPFENGRGLYEKAADPKVFLEISGSHNDGFQDSYDVYLRGLESFLVGEEG